MCTHTHTQCTILIIIYSGSSELKNLLYAQRQNERRETLVEDRTKCHADHVGQGLDRCTTAAVALLKAVDFGDR